MTKIIAQLYAVMDKGPLRALSLVMALVMAGCMFCYSCGPCVLGSFTA